MEKITLNNGDELQGHLIETDGRLFIYLRGISLADAFSLLIVPENTRILKAEQFGKRVTVRGYKRLYSISDEDGQVCAGLKKN